MPGDLILNLKKGRKYKSKDKRYANRTEYFQCSKNMNGNQLHIFSKYPKIEFVFFNLHYNYHNFSQYNFLDELQLLKSLSLLY